ncbi:MAG: polymer-forming cytoskeletal protein [Lachnospiraceae bacterium]|nr:polymer-forming cytoskeletal protein [Lachnospiraceae bacterium]MDD3660162.1 polymer-forming cytoskeletal protein [Lachnospiraceae bacterium]
MGFFQDLKEDLSQAVTELMDEEPDASQAVDKNDVEETALDAEITDSVATEEDSEENEILSDQAAVDEKTVNEVQSETEHNLEAEIADFLKSQETVEVSEEKSDEESYLDTLPVLNKQEKVETKMAEEYKNEEVLDETAIITKGMEIKGNVRSRGSLDVIGSIEGDIDILGKLNITGEIRGNSKAAEVFADAAKIVGEINTDGAVKIGSSSVIIGNITASSAVIAGAVKGDIDVRGPVILDTSAIVMGNIKSKSVQINNGAVIEGLCSQSYADVNPINFFEDIK